MCLAIKHTHKEKRVGSWEERQIIFQKKRNWMFICLLSTREWDTESGLDAFPYVLFHVLGTQVSEYLLGLTEMIYLENNHKGKYWQNVSVGTGIQ